MKWEIHAAAQAVTFLWSLGLGAVLCVWYDFFRLIRMNFPCGRVHILFQDILFWSVGAVFTFLFLLARENGIVRFYVLFGAGIGFMLWRVTLGAVLLCFFGRFFCLLRRFAALLFRPFGRFFAFTRRRWQKRASFFQKKFKIHLFHRKNS